ncbi:NADP-dependent phosphogluconate dehydrogenase [Poriferisphaera sp. WC338]|uniref:NADP-dependent phosphogluconate dehydrogenase n=1 Tax=Poriferisphaera sp. WC338 TaxID=3425129 RepID=UPI003D8177C6
MAKKKAATKKRGTNGATKNDVGLIGLAVMGQNLVLNMADHGFSVSVYNRTTAKMNEFIEKCEAEEPSANRVHGYAKLKAFVQSIAKPRKIIFLVKAGRPVDMVIDELLPLIDKGDILIDGGNSEWLDTIRREKDLAAKGINFVGSGVSGGELGARFGPSLMPGGSKEAWKSLGPIWRAIAAKVDKKTGAELQGAEPGKPVKGGETCTAHLGPDGAGHYVKMVHNGIEYIDMQLICEAYAILRGLLGMKPDEISKVFEDWNTGELSSYLIEITADVLQQKDPVNKRKFFVDSVLDAAGQKGTGKWTAMNALDIGIPANAIGEAVYARCLSALKEQRVAASKVLKGPKVKVIKSNRKKYIDMVCDALYCSKICAYAQGFQLMAEAQKEYNWKLNFGEIAKIWRGGCIIRARFLQKITDAYTKDKKLQNLMLDPYFKKAIHGSQDNWRKIVSMCAEHGISAPAFGSALAYYDGYRSEVLPANLLQGLRDYFGAHTYERVDKKRGQFFHVDWPDPKRPQYKV